MAPPTEGPSVTHVSGIKCYPSLRKDIVLVQQVSIQIGIGLVRLVPDAGARAMSSTLDNVTRFLYSLS